MNQNTKSVFEAAIKNQCLALKEIAETDTKLSKLQKNYILHTIRVIETTTNISRKIAKVNTLFFGVFEDCR